MKKTKLNEIIDKEDAANNTKLKLALYTPPIKVFNLPQLGATIHIHGSTNGNYLYGGDIRPFRENEPYRKLNGYECAMLDYFANTTGMKNKKKLF